MMDKNLSQRFLALDPGGTTGWALFKDGTPDRIGEVSFDSVFQFLIDNPVQLYVIEDYIIRAGPASKGYQHQWNKGEALRIIGAVELLAQQQKAVVVKQQPSIKPIASKMTGVPYTPGKSGTHIFDAVLHGRYFWMKENPSASNENEKSGGSPDEAGIHAATRVTHINSLGGLRKAWNHPSVGMPREQM